jgi:hypothetical protein
LKSGNPARKSGSKSGFGTGWFEIRKSGSKSGSEIRDRNAGEKPGSGSEMPVGNLGED